MGCAGSKEEAVKGDGKSASVPPPQSKALSETAKSETTHISGASSAGGEDPKCHVKAAPPPEQPKAAPPKQPKAAPPPEQPEAAPPPELPKAAPPEQPKASPPPEQLKAPRANVKAEAPQTWAAVEPALDSLKLKPGITAAKPNGKSLGGSDHSEKWGNSETVDHRENHMDDDAESHSSIGGSCDSRLSGRQGSVSRMSTLSLPKRGSARDPVSKEKMSSVHGGTDPGIGRAENQDAYTCCVFRDNIGTETSLQGVFDGHGPDGKRCAAFCSDSIKRLLDEQIMVEMQAPLVTMPASKSMPTSGVHPRMVCGSMMHLTPPSTERGTTSSAPPDRWPKPQPGGSQANVGMERNHIMSMPFSDREERLLHLLFYAMESNLREECNTVMSGTTGTVCLLKPGTAWLASVGDSTSLLISEEEGDEKPTIQTLAGDHRLTNESEKQRVIDSGARVSRRKGQTKGHLRIWLPELDTPGLMVTRSLGDAIGKTIGVTSEPEVQNIELQEGDRYIIMASDGVWDVMSHDRVAEVVMASAGALEQAVEQILAESVAGWHKKKAEMEAKAGKTVRGIGDNITASLVDLRPWINDEASQ